MRDLQRLLRNRNGAAALEFALVGLPFILLLLGLIEFGRGLYIRSALDAAADHAQRAIIINPSASASTLEAMIQETFQAGPLEPIVITNGTDDASGLKYRLVSLSYKMELLLPAPLGGTLRIGSTRRVPVPG